MINSFLFIKLILLLLFSSVSLFILGCKNYEFEVDNNFSIPDSIAINPNFYIKVLDVDRILIAGGCEIYYRYPTGGGCSKIHTSQLISMTQESKISGIAIVDSLGNIAYEFNPAFNRSISVKNLFLLNNEEFFLNCDSIHDYTGKYTPFYCFVDLNNPKVSLTKYYPENDSIKTLFSYHFPMDDLIVCKKYYYYKNDETTKEINRKISSYTKCQKTNILTIESKSKDYSDQRINLSISSKLIERGAINNFDKLMEDNDTGILGISSKEGINSPIIKGIEYADSMYYIFGTFDRIRGEKCSSGLIRISIDGKLDVSFNNIGDGFNGSVDDIHVQKDGKIICVGLFDEYNKKFCNPNIVRLNFDGSIDKSFSISEDFSNSTLLKIDLDSIGNIYLGGTEFDEIGKEKQSIIRLKKRK